MSFTSKRMTMMLFCLASQVDDLIHCTSHTLQLLIEYDPVRQCLDGLRLSSPRTPLGAPATSRMRLSSPSGVLERTEVVDDSTLKRRSLRFGGASLPLTPDPLVFRPFSHCSCFLAPDAATASASRQGRTPTPKRCR